MYLKQFRTGGDRNFGYLAADETSRLAVAVDASYNPEMIVEDARREGLTIRYLFSTHGHHDHTNGNEEAARLTGCTPLLYGSLCPVSGVRIEDGAELPLGALQVKVLYTPGHTDDSICLCVGDVVFTGDTLFVGKVGGTDLAEQAVTEFRSLHENLLSLPETTRVFPGHDYGAAPESTIGHERQTNPFLLQPDLESFIDLKRNWAAYKKAHGIA